MSRQKWHRRKPGSVSGTIIPPPAASRTAPPSDLPPLPQRRSAQRHSTQPAAQPARQPAASVSGERGPAPLQLPEDVRSRLRPVIMPRRSASSRIAGIPDTSRDAAIAWLAAAQPAAAAPAAAEPTAVAAAAEPAAPRRLRRPFAALASGRHVSWLAALTVLALMTAAGTAFALVRVWTSGTGLGPAGVSANGKALAQLFGASAVRARAARWVAREVSSAAIIACDKVMCDALYAAGLPSSSLLVITPAALDPLGADVIAATQVLRSLFGGRLAAEYAPVVLASFGHGPSKIDVRVVAADGAAAYETELSKDLAARRRAGAQLIANKRMRFAAAARAALAAGRVDTRLLITLAALAAQRPIRVLAFYDLPPGAGPSVPLSGVELSAGDHQRWLVSFLRSQNAPYRAAAVSAGLSDGRATVSVRFSRPSPLGLLH